MSLGKAGTSRPLHVLAVLDNSVMLGHGSSKYAVTFGNAKTQFRCLLRWLVREAIATWYLTVVLPVPRKSYVMASRRRHY